jgi:hypothetical protein
MKIFVRNWMIVCLALWASVARGSSVTVAIGTASGAAGKTVAIPVSVRGAQQLGAMRLDLRYDPAVLDVQKVEPGQPGFPAVNVSHHVATPGRVRLVMNASASESVSGDGELFRVIGTAKGASGASCELAVDAVRAWDNTRPDALPAEMLVTVEPGRFTVAAPGLSPGLLAAIVLAAAVGLLLALFAVKRARRTGAGD